VLSSCSAQKVKPVGTDSKKAYILLGEALKQKSYLEYDDALELLDKALAKDPNYIDAWDLKGSIHMIKGEYKEAKIALEKVIQASPDHPYALLELAQILFEEQDYAESRRLLKRILSKGPKAPKYEKALLLSANAEFAEEAVKNPVAFEPENLGPGINTVEEEYFPGLSLDKQTLFYTRRDGRKNIQLQNEDLFESKYSEDQWQTGKNLGKPINTRENEGAFSASADGKFIYFTSCSREGGEGRCDIWRSEKKGNEWGEPVNLGGPVNTRDWESQPSLAADGITLYFISNRPGGYGGTDIWRSVRKGDQWSIPRNLGPEVNTPYDEQFPFIHPDGVTLYFSSYGHPGIGKSDIYFTKLKNGKWTRPTNLGYPINTARDEWNFIVDRTGLTAYMSSDRFDGYGGMDIYSFPLYEAARPEMTSYVKGIVRDKASRKRLFSHVDLYDVETGKVVASTYSDANTGEFLLSMPAGKRYAFEVQSDGYLMHSAQFKLTEGSLLKPFTLNIDLEKIAAGKSVVIENVFFDTDESVLKPESYTELQILVEFLNKNPTIKVEIGGHTDNTGQKSRNLTLSNARAKAVFEYLVSKGIAADRLTHKGYADEAPIADNNTEEGRSKNRRTEFKVTGLE